MLSIVSVSKCILTYASLFRALLTFSLHRHGKELQMQLHRFEPATRGLGREWDRQGSFL